MNPMNDIDPKQYNVACKYFMNGFCRNGRECSHYHPQPNEFMIYYSIMLREQLISHPPPPTMVPYCHVIPAYFVNQPIPTTTSNPNHIPYNHQQTHVPPNISMYSEVFEDGDDEVTFYQPKVCTFYLSGKGCKYGYHCKFFHPTIQSPNRVNHERSDCIKSLNTSPSPNNSITLPLSKIKKISSQSR